MLRAWEWTDGRQRVERKEEEIEAKEKEIGKVRKGKERCLREIESAEKDVEQVQAQRDKELKKGGKYKKLEEEVSELEKVLVKIRTQVEIKTGTVADEDKKADALQAELKEVCRKYIYIMFSTDDSAVGRRPRPKASASG